MVNKFVITVPPIHFRNKILQRYKKQIKTIGYLDAIVNYKNSMQNLYIRYNPHIKRKPITRNSVLQM